MNDLKALWEQKIADYNKLGFVAKLSATNPEHIKCSFSRIFDILFSEDMDVVYYDDSYRPFFTRVQNKDFFFSLFTKCLEEGQALKRSDVCLEHVRNCIFGHCMVS